jgi:hypothetical protein
MHKSHVRTAHHSYRNSTPTAHIHRQANTDIIHSGFDLPIDRYLLRQQQRPVPSSHENMSSLMSFNAGGYNGPEASPPPMMTAPVCAGKPLRSKKCADAINSAAPPSARRAHSKRAVTDATAGDANTCSIVRGSFVSANGCWVAMIDMAAEHAANSVRVTPNRSIWYRATRS